MISLKKSFVYKDLCYLMSLWSVKLPSELQKHSGRQFDPYLVKIFTEMLGKDKSNPSEKFS